MILTKEYVSEFLEYNPETGKIYWKVNKSPLARKGKEAGCVWRGDRYLEYRVIRLDDKLYKAHRLAFLIMEGRFPTHIDHINGNGIDNRWCNLREVSHQTNHRNESLSRNNKSGFTGVRYSEKLKKWVATIKVNYKTKHLGVFINKKDAIKARQEANIKYGFHKNHGRKRGD